MLRTNDPFIALRCLQQLCSSSAGVADATAIARAECLDPGVVDTALRELAGAGLVLAAVGGGRRYRLARPAAEIRLTDVWAALGAGPGPPGDPGLTLADLSAREDDLFAGAGVAVAV